MCNGRPATEVGTAAGEILVGTQGDDVIVGLGGDDSIYGKAGADIICGGRGNDTIIANDHDSDGSDTGVIEYVSNRLSGGPGHDTVYGSSGDDVLVGKTGGDVLLARAGDDVVKGGAGSDTLTGNAGRDVLWGGRGYRDRLNGGDAPDVIDGDAPRVHNANGIDVLEHLGQHGTDRGVVVDMRTRTSVTSTGTDVFRHIERVSGSFGDDVMRGNRKANVFYGEEGDDLLIGRGGDDKLRGLWGRDETRGGRGRDGCFAELQRRCEYRLAPLPGREN